MANLYTKTGDSGTTGLVGGNRVSKADPRVQCYGIVDETSSMLGLAYAFSNNEFVKTSIHDIQVKLFTLGAELASDEKGMQRLKDGIIHNSDVEELEKLVDRCTEITGKQSCFVVPGANKASSALHVARTFIRRCEREMISVKDRVTFPEETYRYVNRLSDAIYALARVEETEVEQSELRDKIKDMILESLGEKEGVQMSPECGLNLSVAKKLASAAENKAREIGVPIVVTIVDNGGNAILVHRMDDAFQGSIDVSMNKAYTANAFRMPTDVLGKAAQPGESLYGIEQTNGGRIVLFGGGYPLSQNGKHLGAVGVSGGTAEQDMAVARAAVEAFG